MRVFTYALLAALLSLGAPAERDDWSWKDGESQQFTAEDAQIAATSFSESAIANATDLDEVIDSILTRQGRNLEEFDEVYTDPNVQEALQKGDDGEARNLIREKLCGLGLMQCDGVQGKRPYIAPEDLVYAQPVAINPVGRPIPTIPLKGGPIRGGYGPPKPMPFPPGPPPFKYGPPKPHGPPRREFGPPKPYYPNRPFQSGSTFSESSFESSRPPFGGIQSEFPYEIESSSFAHHKDKKPVEVIVNAQGGTASGSTGVQQHVHHHFHHGDEKIPAVVVPVASGATGGNFVQSSGFKPSASLSFGGYKGNGFSSSLSGSNVLSSGTYGGSGLTSGSFGGSSLNSGGFGSAGLTSGSFGSSGLTSGSFGSSGLTSGSFGNSGSFGLNSKPSLTIGGGGSGIYGGQSTASYGGSTGLGAYGAVRPVSENYGPQTFGSSPSSLYTNSIGASVGYYGSSDFYKKSELNGGVQSNSLQSGYGDKYQGFESARNENYDCVCVPYDQCPSHEVIGRKDDLTLALDPRSLKTGIEAEDERVVTDGNGTMTIVRVTKEAPVNAENVAKTTEAKKVKREAAAEKKEDKTQTDGRQAYYGGGGFGRPQTCGPRHVCCRRPVRPNVPSSSAFRQCGTRHSQGINGRIKNPVYVDGDSEFGEYPWQVAILKKDPKESVYVCGGTLIDPLHILTAAHCVKSYTAYDIRVRLGEWDVNHDVEFYPYVERDVSRVEVHPEFYTGTLYNDIAVLRMDKPVDFSRHPHISPACLPSPHEDYTGSRCWTTGWGKDAFGDFGKYQNILKETDVPIVGNELCQRQLQQTRLGYDFKLHPGFVCAGGEEGKDACKGDGGGPMVCERGGAWNVVGVVSWGIGCGQIGVPGVYVKVSHYLDWIRQVTQRF